MIHHGDLFTVLPTLDAESIDACVTDPPYGIAFMNKAWDNFSPAATAARIVPNRAQSSENPNLKGRTRGPASSPSAVEYNRSLEGQRGFQEWTARWASEVFRVLKPGAHLVVCGAPRSHHRMMCGLEDAGFEMRDCLAWLFGQGFPKSRNLGHGWGTALKPGHEPIALARKPFKGSITANHARYGVGGLNVDGCRIEGEPWNRDATGQEGYRHQSSDFRMLDVDKHSSDLGRWPANVLLDAEAAQLLDEQSGELTTSQPGTTSQVAKFSGDIYNAATTPQKEWGYGDIGGASRFFYVAKPSREERDLGCEQLGTRSGAEKTGRREGSAGLKGDPLLDGQTVNPYSNGSTSRNFHPTVKPLALMRWLVKLVTPANGIVLDPFGGSGTTAMACAAEGLDFILIEREAEYVPIIEARVRAIAPLFSSTRVCATTAADAVPDVSNQQPLFPRV